MEVAIPRDRDGSFEPQIVRKRQRRLSGIDGLVISLSAKGLTHGEIAAHLAEVYDAQVSKQTISTITDRVIEGMSEWQNRPLDPERSAAAVAGALPAVQGHPCVVAGDGAIAQSVCGGTHLGCAGRTMLLEGWLPESWIPPAHVVEMRTLGRLYCALMDERRAWQQRIHAQLFYQAGRHSCAAVAGRGRHARACRAVGGGSSICGYRVAAQW